MKTYSNPKYYGVIIADDDTHIIGSTWGSGARQRMEDKAHDFALMLKKYGHFVYDTKVVRAERIQDVRAMYAC